MQLVKTTVTDGVGELVLNRPEQRNSLTGPLVDELIRGLSELQNDSECRCIIIRGEGGYFCAGLDLKAFTQEPAPEWKPQFTDKWTQFHKQMFECDKPTIAAVERFAIAGGSSLAFSCDFIVIGEEAFIHVSEVERGMLAPLNIFWLGVRHSYQTALKMALMGERHKGAVLKGMGIAECVADDAEVLSEARKLAKRFAGFNPANTQHLKRSIRSGAMSGNFEQLLDRVKANSLAAKTIYK